MIPDSIFQLFILIFLYLVYHMPAWPGGASQAILIPVYYQWG